MNEEFEVLNFEEPKKFSVLDTYGENLKTKFYLTDPAIGRDKEIKETLLILLTPEKSAMLVGKPGIGKTAIVEGVGYRMQKGEVPDALKNYDLIKINISSLLGNVSSDGVNENKLQILVDELKQRENIILFIDEVHLLVSRNTSNLNVDFANMLKPGLDRGTIKMIGATTTYEYERYIMRDKAFLRRFEKVDVSEPTEEMTVEILLKTLPKLEKQTGVMLPYTDFINEKIMKFIVNMTTEFKRVYEISSRYPDIALVILRQCFSNAIYENRRTINFKNIYDAIKTTKAVYPDVIAKELVSFKEIFKDELKIEGTKLD